MGKRPGDRSNQARLDRITSTRKRKKALAKLMKQSKALDADDSDEGKPRKPYQFLFDYGTVEVEAMTYIRGRSLANYDLYH